MLFAKGAAGVAGLGGSYFLFKSATANSGPPNADMANFTHVVHKYRQGPFLCAAAELCGLRSEMEDALHMSRGSQGTYFFGVFDGHGGDKCSAYAATAFPKEVLSLRPPIKAPALVAAAKKIDTLACQKTSDGCCAAFAVVWPDPQGTMNVTVGNIGDSRVFGIC